MSYPPKNLDLYFSSCGYPGTPLHGQLLETEDVDVNIEGVVEFGCDEGYELEGSSNRTCLLSGQWSGKETICKSKTIKHDSKKYRNFNSILS